MSPKDPALQGEEDNTSVRVDMPAFGVEFSKFGRISVLPESSLESAFYPSLFGPCLSSSPVHWLVTEPLHVSVFWHIKEIYFLSLLFLLTHPRPGFLTTPSSLPERDLVLLIHVWKLVSKQGTGFGAPDAGEGAHGMRQLCCI